MKSKFDYVKVFSVLWNFVENGFWIILEGIFVCVNFLYLIIDIRELMFSDFKDMIFVMGNILFLNCFIICDWFLIVILFCDGLR